jgi:phosphatidylglycerophosphate synthase
MRVAGLTVLERSIKQLRRLGYGVSVAGDGSIAVPDGLEVHSVPAAEAPGEPGVPSVAADVVRPGGRDLDGGMRVTNEPSRRHAEDAIFAELLRGDLGFVARTLNKPISFRITRYVLCRLPVTPNQVTLGGAAVGLYGCALVATGSPGLMVLGFLLAHLQSVLDGCDGELARVRFQQSAIGEWLDTVVDDSMNLALVAAVGVGLSQATGSDWPRALAILGCGMLITYNVVAYRELLRQGEGGEVLKVRWWFARGGTLKEYAQRGARSPWPLRLVGALGRRDSFVLAWFVLAALGLFWWILVYALIMALGCFVVAIGQLVHRRSGAGRKRI